MLTLSCLQDFVSPFDGRLAELPVNSAGVVNQSEQLPLVCSAARRESLADPYLLSEKYFVKVVPVLLTQRRQPSKAVVS